MMRISVTATSGTDRTPVRKVRQKGFAKAYSLESSTTLRRQI